MKTALEVSGGKDSMVLVHMYRDQLAGMTVYWCNPGDPDEHTISIIGWIKECAPNFVEVRSNVRAFRAQFGMPSPVVPLNSQVPVISDQICCMHNIMIPLQARVLADGNTCIIRGQKAADVHKGGLNDGAVVEGVLYRYPLENWTDEDVIAYLQDHDLPIHPVYAYSSHGIDCLHCTGWWSHGHMDYLRDTAPRVHRLVQAGRSIIKRNIHAELAQC
jgi:phosphoadenosine phosphosulfate reductase